MTVDGWMVVLTLSLGLAVGATVLGALLEWGPRVNEWATGGADDGNVL